MSPILPHLSLRAEVVNVVVGTGALAFRVPALVERNLLERLPQRRPTLLIGLNDVRTPLAIRLREGSVLRDLEVG
jgi:hypothetical protein